MWENEEGNSQTYRGTWEVESETHGNERSLNRKWDGDQLERGGRRERTGQKRARKAQTQEAE